MVKYHSPLPLYLKLDLEPLELYHRFLRYVLDAEQLKANGFPLESPNNPRKAVLKGCLQHPFLNSPNDRICSRCQKKFTVSKDGSYQSETTCCYHSGKRQRRLGDIYNDGAYSCCGNPGTSDGCIVRKQHVSTHGCLDKVEFVKTREKHQNPNYHIYALDCEMCYTVQGLEVTRICIVGTDGLTVYDSFVLPENPIIDYNTMYSGITANHLKNVKTTLADVQAFLLKLLTSSTILVGHGLENDLNALHLIHETVVDTSIVFSSHQETSRKLSLKTIADNYLKKTIQQGSCGHDSVEDARTCIELMLWKVQKDSQADVPPQQTSIPVITPTATPTQYRQRPLNTNPVITRAPTPTQYRQRPPNTNPVITHAPTPTQYRQRPPNTNPVINRAPTPTQYRQRPPNTNPVITRAPTPTQYRQRPPNTNPVITRAPTPTQHWQGRSLNIHRVIICAPTPTQHWMRPLSINPVITRAPTPTQHWMRPISINPVITCAPTPTQHWMRPLSINPVITRAPTPTQHWMRPLSINPVITHALTPTQQSQRGLININPVITRAPTPTQYWMRPLSINPIITPAPTATQHRQRRQ